MDGVEGEEVKVRELIERLQEFDEETRVVVRGQEEGVDDPTDVDCVRIRLDVNPQCWFSGDHEIVKDTKTFSDTLAIYVH